MYVIDAGGVGSGEAGVDHDPGRFAAAFSTRTFLTFQCAGILPDLDVQRRVRFRLLRVAFQAPRSLSVGARQKSGSGPALEQVHALVPVRADHAACLSKRTENASPEKMTSVPSSSTQSGGGTPSGAARRAETGSANWSHAISCPFGAHGVPA